MTFASEDTTFFSLPSDLEESEVLQLQKKLQVLNKLMFTDPSESPLNPTPSSSCSSWGNKHPRSFLLCKRESGSFSFIALSRRVLCSVHFKKLPLAQMFALSLVTWEILSAIIHAMMPPPFSLPPSSSSSMLLTFC